MRPIAVETVIGLHLPELRVGFVYSRPFGRRAGREHLMHTCKGHCSRFCGNSHHQTASPSSNPSPLQSGRFRGSSPFTPRPATFSGVNYTGTPCSQPVPLICDSESTHGHVMRIVKKRDYQHFFLNVQNSERQF
jgi:hypothetical protein